MASKIKEIMKILYDLKIERHRKIKEIKKILYDSKTTEDYYKPIKINNAFKNNYIEHQSNGDKDKTLLKSILISSNNF